MFMSIYTLLYDRLWEIEPFWASKDHYTEIQQLCFGLWCTAAVISCYNFPFDVGKSGEKERENSKRHYVCDNNEVFEQC